MLREESDGSSLPTSRDTTVMQERRVSLWSLSPCTLVSVSMANSPPASYTFSASLLQMNSNTWAQGGEGRSCGEGVERGVGHSGGG